MDKKRIPGVSIADQIGPLLVAPDSNKSSKRASLHNIASTSIALKCMESGSDDCLPERGLWTGQLDFVFSCISYAVGLGNVWRFPYLCYDNGGGAFLVPWLLCIVLCGIPLFVLEVSLGQYLNTGGICVWNLVPLFKGIGYASMVMIGLCNIYYIVLIAWTLFYFVASFDPALPWSECHGQNRFCLDLGAANATLELAARNLSSSDLRIVSPVKDYWERHVLGITSGLHEMGSIRWPLLTCLLVAWLMVYFVIWRGLHKSGRIIWFTATFPYLILFVLLVRGLTLDGASMGLRYLLTPRWERLKEAKVWVSAATQVLFSYGIGIGANIALGSYNRYHHNFYRDSLIACCIGSGTSLLSSVVIFSVLGHMAFSAGKPVSQVAKSGPGLAFLAYPEVVMQLPLAPVWAVLFFLMLIILGTDSQFCTVEAFVTGLVDEYAVYLRPRRRLFTLAVCVISFLLGVPLVMEGGMYVFQLMDFFSASGFSLLTVVFCEIVGLCWIYGSSNLNKNMEDMLGFQPGRWLSFAWTYTAPLTIVSIFVFSIIRYEPLNYADTYEYPWWGELLGWSMAAASILCIPTYALLYLAQQSGPWKQRLRTGLTCAALPRKENDRSYIQDDASALDVMLQNNPASGELTD